MLCTGGVVSPLRPGAFSSGGAWCSCSSPLKRLGVLGLQGQAPTVLAFPSRPGAWHGSAGWMFAGRAAGLDPPFALSIAWIQRRHELQLVSKGLGIGSGVLISNGP